jgi:hypothetical protein
MKRRQLSRVDEGWRYASSPLSLRERVGVRGPYGDDADTVIRF